MAYPRLVMSVMPPGLRGLIMAVIISALTSELDSIFNSSSTIFTLDIYKMVRKQVPSLKLMIVGRLLVWCGVHGGGREHCLGASHR